MVRIIVIVISVLLFCSTSYSEEAYVMGAGNASCGKWIESRNKPELHDLMGQWLAGFITGVNWYSGKKQVIPPDKESMVAFIDQYCRNNSLHSLVSAAAALVQESGGPKTRHEWKK